MKVSTVWRQGYKTLRYWYRANSYLSFDFNLLSEVGEPWQKQMGEMAQRLVPEGYAIKQVELSVYPWYVDAIVKEAP